MQKSLIKSLLNSFLSQNPPLNEKETEILKDINWYVTDGDATYGDGDNIALRDNMEEELEIAADEYPYLLSDLNAFLSKIGYPETVPNSEYPNRN